MHGSEELEGDETSELAEMLIILRAKDGPSGPTAEKQQVMARLLEMQSQNQRQAAASTAAAATVAASAAVATGALAATASPAAPAAASDQPLTEEQRICLYRHSQQQLIKRRERSKQQLHTNQLHTSSTHPTHTGHHTTAPNIQMPMGACMLVMDPVLTGPGIRTLSNDPDMMDMQQRLQATQAWHMQP